MQRVFQGSATLIVCSSDSACADNAFGALPYPSPDPPTRNRVTRKPQFSSAAAPSPCSDFLSAFLLFSFPEILFAPPCIFQGPLEFQIFFSQNPSLLSFVFLPFHTTEHPETDEASSLIYGDLQVQNQKHNGQHTVFHFCASE